ncbi:MAG: hypothetical protein KAQ68_07940 [Clostridiales bacterium]|nr:hypothetical protein [Clostridiales bacterium]
MTLENLMKWRIIIPGLIIFIMISLLSTSSEEEFIRLFSLIDKSNFNASIYIAISVILGVFYYGFGIGKLTFKPIDKRFIQKNIRKRIVKMIEEDSSLKMQVDNEKKIINIVWKLVENDSTLDIKSKIIRLNGLIWSSLTDLVMISMIFAIIFLVKYFTTMNDYFLLVFCGLLTLCVVTALLNVIIIAKHRRLSNSQLDYIETHCKGKLQACLKDML